MDLVQLPALGAATYGVLALSVLSLWCARRVWTVLFGCAIVLGYAAQVLHGAAVLWIALLVGAAHLTQYDHSPTRASALVVVIVIALALGLHVLSGFSNPQVWRDVVFSANAAPYSMHLNFDKTAAGLLILALCYQDRIASWPEWRLALRATVLPMVMTVAVLIAASMLAGYARYEPKWIAAFALWAPVNLLFTCMSEEAFFRGLIQQRLQNAFAAQASGRWFALATAALLFGIAHVGGGVQYVALSTLAGLGYGYVFMRSGRVEMAILTHFLVNATHFVFFTYPRAA